MGASGEPTQHVFGADNGERKGLERAVEGRDHHESRRLHEGGGGVHESREIGDVLDHLHVEHDVEPFARRRQVFDRCEAVVDRETGGFGMAAGDLDI
jgi:hypothetical protein